MRRKRLKFQDVERTEHGEYLVLLDRQLDDVKYRLLDPGMNDEEMQRAKDEVDKLFSVNVDKEEPEEGEEGEAAEQRVEAAGEKPEVEVEPVEESPPAEKEEPAASKEVEAPEERTEAPVPSDEANDGQGVSEVHKS
jgi:hypothetical protein